MEEQFLQYIKISNFTLLSFMILFLYIKYNAEPRIKFILIYLLCPICFIFGYGVIQSNTNLFFKWIIYIGVTISTYTFYLVTNLFFVFDFKLSRREFYLFFYKLLTTFVSFIPGKFFYLINLPLS